MYFYSCCVDEVSAEHFKADAIVHFGHSCLSSTTRVPSLLVFPTNNINTEDFITKLQENVQDPQQRLLLMYDVAYFHALGETKSFAFNNNMFLYYFYIYF